MASEYESNRALAIVHKYFPKVAEVKDATRALAIQVTKQDTTARGRKKHTACALAKACNRRLHLDGAIISMSRAYLVKGTTATRYEVPTTVAREITSFDRGAGFAPGLYQLYSPTSNHKIGTKRPTKYGPKKKKRQTPRHTTDGIRAALA